MKRVSIWLAIPLAIALAGCKPPTTTQPLAPGYANQADETMGQTLAAAHDFYVSAATMKDLTAGEKAVLNDLGTAINAAQSAYKAFHSGTATQAAAQAAVDQVTSKQATAQALIPGVKP